MAVNTYGTNLCSVDPNSGAGVLTGILTDEAGRILFGRCRNTPPATANLFEHGSLMIQFNSGSGNSALWQNTGTRAAPVWTIVGSILNTSPLIVGDGTANATIKSNGNFDLILQTGNATTGSITIQDGANGAINITPNGSGVTSIGSGSGTASLEGFVSINGPLSVNDVPTVFNANGALPINKTSIDIDTTGGAIALTLADATVGRIMFLRMIADGGDAVITPTSLLGFTTITFNNVGDTALLFFSTGGWAVLGGSATVA